LRNAVSRQRFLPEESGIVIEDNRDIGWLLVVETADEIFLKQMFLRPAAQLAYYSPIFRSHWRRTPCRAECLPGW
jgi:hypothetical protein